MATAMQDPSYLCDLHHSSWPCQVLNPLSKAREQTHSLMESSWVLNLPGHGGNSCTDFKTRCMRVHSVTGTIKPWQHEFEPLKLRVWQSVSSGYFFVFRMKKKKKSLKALCEESSFYPLLVGLGSNQTELFRNGLPCWGPWAGSHFVKRPILAGIPFLMWVTPQPAGHPEGIPSEPYTATLPSTLYLASALRKFADMY